MKVLLARSVLLNPFLVVCFLCFSIYSHAQWKRLDISGTIYKINCIDSTCFFVARGSNTTNHYIAQSKDAGVTWCRILESNVPLGGVYPLSSDTIFYTQDSSLFRSIDGGTSFSSIYTGSEELGQVYARGSRITLINGSGDVLISYDNGQNWTSGQAPEDRKIQFVNDSVAYAASLWTGVAKTTDGGLTWTIINGSLFETQDVSFLNPDTGFVVGRTGSNRKIIKTTDGGNTWTDLPTTPNVGGEWLRNCHFYNDSIGLVATKEIYRTTDGGSSWTLVQKSNGDYLNQFEQIGPNITLTGRYHGKVLKTEDQGATWSTMTNLNFNSPHWEIEFVDSLVGFLATEFMSKTVNGGKTFTPVSVNGWGTRILASDISFPVSNDTGYVIGYRGLARTADLGTTWDSIHPEEGSLCHFFTGTHGLVLRSNKELWETSDGGNSWQILILPTSWDVEGLTCVNEDVWFVNSNDPNGPGQETYRTLDGGASWTTIAFPPGFVPQPSISFPSSDTGFVIGRDSSIARTYDGGNTWTVLSNLSINTNHNNPRALHFLNAQEGLGLFTSESLFADGSGSRNYVHFTSDGGLNWNLLYLDEFKPAAIRVLYAGDRIWLGGWPDWASKSIYHLANPADLFNAPCPIAISGNPTSIVCDSVLLSTNASSPFQWMLNGEDIPGAQSATLHTNNFDSGNEFRIRNDYCISAGQSIAKFQPLDSIITVPPYPYCDVNAVVMNVNNVSNIIWSSGSTDSTLTISTSGTYSATYTDTNGCQQSDSIAVDFFDRPKVIIDGADSIAFCANAIEQIVGEALQYDSTVLRWNLPIGQINSQYEITPTASGEYVLQTVGLQCDGFDTIQVKIHDFVPSVNLGPNQVFASGDTISISAWHPSNVGYQVQYSWSTGESDTAIQVTMPGLYSVTVSDTNGCSSFDSIQVEYSTGLGESTFHFADVLLYPNPTFDQLTIKVDLSIVSQQIQVQIIRPDGLVVQNTSLQGQSKYDLVVGDLPPGLYLLAITSPNNPPIIKSFSKL